MIPATPPNIPLTRRQTPRGYIRNDTAANMLLWRAKLTALLTGTETLGAINLVGDSHMLGIGAVYYRNTIGARLAAMFRSAGFTVADHKFGVYSSTASTTTYDPRFQSFTGTWGVWQDLPGGKTFRCTSSGGKMVYNPSAIVATSFDTANLMWFRDTSGNGGGGNMIITVDGGATNFSTPSSGGSVASQTISQSGAASIQSTIITVAAGQHTIEITNDTTGNIQVYGIEVYNVATPTLMIRTMGASGYSSVNYVASNIPQRFYENAAIQSQLQVFCLGDNDAINGTALATYSANLATLKSALTVGGSASLLGLTWPPCAVATVAQATQQSYVSAFLAAMGTSMTLDQWQHYADIGGYEGSSLYNGTLHLSTLGEIDSAASLFAAIMPQGV